MNFPEHENYVCTLSKKKVDFSREAIQQAYNLPEYVEQVFEDNLSVMYEPYLWVIFLETICGPGKEVVWLIRDHKFYFNSLTTKGKYWFHIINNRLMPSWNKTEVYCPPTTLMRCFINEHDFDAAKVGMRWQFVHRFRYMDSFSRP